MNNTVNFASVQHSAGKPLGNSAVLDNHIYNLLALICAGTAADGSETLRGKIEMGLIDLCFYYNDDKLYNVARNQGFKVRLLPRQQACQPSGVRRGWFKSFGWCRVVGAISSRSNGGRADSERGTVCDAEAGRHKSGTDKLIKLTLGIGCVPSPLSYRFHSLSSI